MMVHDGLFLIIILHFLSSSPCYGEQKEGFGWRW